MNRTEAVEKIREMQQIADRFELCINHWHRITGYGVSGSELVFGVSALPDAEEKFSGLGSDTAAYR